MTAVGHHYVLAADAAVSDPSDVAIRVTLIAVMGSVPVFASVFVTAIVAIVVVVAVVNLVFVLEKIEHQRHIFGLKLYPTDTNPPRPSASPFVTFFCIRCPPMAF